MKIYFLPLFLALALQLSAQQDKPISDALKDYNLKGQVKSIAENREFAGKKTDKNAKNYISKIDVEFDKRGMVSKIRSYWADGTLFEVKDARYDNDSNRIELKTIATSRFKLSRSKLTFRDSGGKTSRMTPAANDGQWSILTYANDGNPNGSVIYNKDSSVYSKSIYKRDAAGKLLATDQVDDTGKLWSQTIFETDSSGRRIITIYQRRDGALFKHMVITRDTLDRELESYIFKPDGNVSMHTTYKYDVKGNNVEYKWMDRNGKVSWVVNKVYSKFDDRNNWTRARELWNGVLKHTVKRQIKYY
jgi:hypothetical protein